jgi:hypothetical protein
MDLYQTTWLYIPKDVVFISQKKVSIRIYFVYFLQENPVVVWYARPRASTRYGLLES